MPRTTTNNRAAIFDKLIRHTVQQHLLNSVQSQSIKPIVIRRYMSKNYEFYSSSSADSKLAPDRLTVQYSVLQRRPTQRARARSFCRLELRQCTMSVDSETNVKDDDAAPPPQPSLPTSSETSPIRNDNTAPPPPPVVGQIDNSTPTPPPPDHPPPPQIQLSEQSHLSLNDNSTVETMSPSEVDEKEEDESTKEEKTQLRQHESANISTSVNEDTATETLSNAKSSVIETVEEDEAFAAPVVAEIMEATPDGASAAIAAYAEQQYEAPGDLDAAEEGLHEVRAEDLAALIELYNRFQVRIERLATGRKLGPLRDAWIATRAEFERYPNKLDVGVCAEKLIEAIKLGVESGRVLIVDACLDCVHRLFEYGHIGAPHSATKPAGVVLDKRGGGAIDDLVSLVCSCLEVKEDEVYLRMVQTIFAATTQTKAGLHHGSLLAAVRTVYNIYLNAREPGVRTSARVCIVQTLSLVFSRMEAEVVDDGGARLAALTSSDGLPKPISEQKDDENNTPSGVDIPRPEPPAEEGGEAGVDFASVLQKDAYLLFRALCKISAKDVPDGAPLDGVGYRSKLLSLELLRSLVNKSGPAFRTGERFIYALRQYLAPSILANAMSSAMPVVDVSLDIFELLLRKETLRPLLKAEIAAVFKAVIFRFVESPTAGPQRRRKSLELLNRLAANHQTLADLFLNYDCDMDSPNIFERIVQVLSAAAENKNFGAMNLGAAPANVIAERAEIRLTSLSGVMLTVRSLRNWCKPIEDERARKAADDATGIQLDDDDRPADDLGDMKVEESNGINEKSASLSALSTSSSFLGRVSEGSDRDTSKFEEAIRLKKVMVDGIVKFNTKPKKGMEYLISNGRLPKDEKVIAEFLHRTEKLDATMIGEYLGEGDPFSISVMHAYTDMNDFTDLAFDLALRKHLAGFRLPGESQKIDRIMEKFASRYCECNPGVFANADAAYVLAYSVIMLHTDAHNATIKNKMSKDEFIRNNRGINDGKDVDPKLLSVLYDRIVATEIKLAGNLKDTANDVKKDRKGSASMQTTNLDPALLAKKFKQESEQLMAQTKVMFAKRRKTAEDYTYYSATNVYHARLMFETACFPVLAAISLLLEEATPSDGDIVAMCLEGFRDGIAIASTFDMTTAKNAFVLSLSKFTHLNHLAEMRAKNVECVKHILKIAAMEGNNLGDQWVVIVRAISQLEQIRAMAAGNPEKYLLMKTQAPATRLGGEKDLVKPDASSGQLQTKRSLARATAPGSAPASEVPIAPFDNIRLDKKAATLAAAIGENEIERIFTNSAHLSPAGVVDFTGALCTVSLEELSERTGARLFCLQKIIELAYYNMESRTRLHWAKIWGKMGPFFANAMCHKNKDVAMYSIDALRQLAKKFLAKDELSNFSFQREFLRPFEVCFSRTKSDSTRELLLTCVSQMVLTHADNIKSGWKSVFSLLGLSSEDSSEDIMMLGFEITQNIVDKFLGVHDEVFVDAVSGISAYVRSSKSLEVSLTALDKLANQCADALGEGRAISRTGLAPAANGAPASDNFTLGDEDGGEGDEGVLTEVFFSAENDADISAWFSVLTVLASSMQDSREDVSRAASAGMFRVLNKHGGKFQPALWKLIFRGVLSPLFDDVRYLSATTDKQEAAAISAWALSFAAPSLRSIVDVFVKHIEVTRDMLPDLLELLRGWVVQETETVAREGMGILARLLMMSGDVLQEKDWHCAVVGIRRLFNDTIPHEIIGPKDLNPDKTEPDIDDLDDFVKDFNKEKEGKANGTVEKDGKHDAEGEDEVEGLEGTNKSNSPSPVKTVTMENVEKDQPRAVPRLQAERENRTIDFRVVRSKCVVQLLLIQLVQDVVVSFYTKITTEHIGEMAAALHDSYTFAKQFNANVELRYSLWRAGFMNQVPNLLKQETSGLTTYMRIMFWLYLDPDREDEGEQLERAVVTLCDSVLKRFISTSEAPNAKADDRREIAALTPVVILIVNGMMQMSTEQFFKHLGDMYAVLLQLMESASDRKVRRAISRLMRARIGPQLRRLVASGAVGAGSSSSTAGREDGFVARPQIPGSVRDRVLAVEGEENAEGVESGIQTALSKLSGVREATVSMEQGVAKVAASTPDDLIISTIEAVPKVRSVFLVGKGDAPLLVG